LSKIFSTFIRTKETPSNQIWTIGCICDKIVWSRGERSKKEEMENMYQSKLKECTQACNTEKAKMRKEIAKMRKRMSLLQDEFQKERMMEDAVLSKDSTGKKEEKRKDGEKATDGMVDGNDKEEDDDREAELDALKRELAEAHQQIDEMARSMTQMKESQADRSKTLHEVQRRAKKMEKKRLSIEDENKE
jgi:hypothetical protein